MKLQIVPVGLMENYLAMVPANVQGIFERLHEHELSIETFSFYTSVSAVFSSKIEGEPIEMDSYLKYKLFATEFLPSYTRKIDDLYEAYLFAQKNELTKKNIGAAHSLITAHILVKALRGKIRTGNMVVLTGDGRIEYVAAAPVVKAEMKKFYADIESLLATEMSFFEALFFASLIHLVFVKIHPFGDGNGRTARLLEKWFLAQKLGSKAWFVQSEKYYYDNHKAYYDNIRRLGLEYDGLDFNNALPFLLMLPKSFSSNQ